MPVRPRRGVWVWHPVPVGPLVAFVVARHVEDLFVAVPHDLDARPNNRAWLLELARAAGAWGVRLQALGGDPAWGEAPQAALAWQRAALGLGIFAGTHVDAEFWTHPDWSRDPVGVAARFLDMVGRLRDAGPLECDVPWWLHEHQDAHGNRLDAALLHRVDAVTALTYRTTAQGKGGILEIGAPALQAGAATGTPVRLAVDASPPRPGEEHTSFHGRTAGELDAVLRAVDLELGTAPAYVGMGIHDLDHWRRLRQEPAPA